MLPVTELGIKAHIQLQHLNLLLDIESRRKAMQMLESFSGLGWKGPSCSHPSAMGRETFH